MRVISGGHAFLLGAYRRHKCVGSPYINYVLLLIPPSPPTCSARGVVHLCLMNEQTDGTTRDHAIGLAGGQFEAAGRTNHAGRAKTKITRSRAVCVRGHCGDGPRIQSRHTEARSCACPGRRRGGGAGPRVAEQGWGLEKGARDTSAEDDIHIFSPLST